RMYAGVGARLGPSFLAQYLHQLTGLLERYARELKSTQDDALWRLWDLLLPLAEALPAEEHSDPTFAALNAPIGNLTAALLVNLGERNPLNYKNVSASLRARLARLLSGLHSSHSPARLLLARSSNCPVRLH